MSPTKMEPKKDTREDMYIRDISAMSNTAQFDAIFFERSSKRTEKIVTALYMVSDFIKDSEPIKFELRSSGLVLLSKTFDISKNRGIAFKSILPDVLSTTKKLIAFLEVAATLSLISDMNYQILRNELMALHGGYESKFTNFGVDIRSIIKGEKLVENKPKVLQESKPFPQVFYKGHVKDMFNKEKDSFSNKVLDIGESKGQSSTKESLKTISESTDANERKNKIISILKIRDSITIGEISVDIKNVSEKTIQRDLQSLIDTGVVSRIGERRWSKYKLTSHNA